MNATPPPPPASPDSQGTSTRPYLIRALHDWCTDNGFTPYLAVHVDGAVQVPMEYVKNHEIVLNVGFEATSGLKLGNDFIEFKARFGGVAREIIVPVDHVVAIYARENGQGMAFPMPNAGADGAAPGPAAADAPAGRGPRGLRLASADDEGGTQPADAADDTAAAARPEGAAPEGDEPPPPPRPTLKRVK
ncbi:ClpXP protease specificity-enhancing factor [Ideonella sp.]|uniref:ClpXP protease specificity-enhancing factor n=1 Tax=Ideonella sp. TaxID=1929293 RepID=UPI0035B15FCC